jgi:hypothetical protein
VEKRTICAPSWANTKDAASFSGFFLRYFDYAEMQREIKLEDINHSVLRSKIPSRELGLIVQTGLNFRHNNVQTSRPEKETVTIETKKAFKREDIEHKYEEL